MTRNAIRVRPIRTEADHDAAVARITELMGAVPGTPEGDELDVLATLADAWEARNHPIDPPDPVMAIQFRMEQQGLTRKDLEPMLGSRARVSEVLTGKRKLTIGMIRRVRSGLGISADLLIDSASTKYRRSAGRHPGVPTFSQAQNSSAARLGSAMRNRRVTAR